MSIAEVLTGERSWAIECTDARAGLAALPDGCVQAIVTSPPYWGLRAYGTEPETWGGDPACSHDWGELERGRRKDILPSDQTALVARIATSARQDGAGTNGGRLCRRCGAWLGELGLEPSPALWIDHLTGIFAECRRVMRPDGTLWLNVGDAYSGSGKGQKGDRTHASAGWKQETNRGTLSGGLPVLARGAPASWKGQTFDHHHVLDRGGPTGVVENLPAKSLLMLPARLTIALQDDGWLLRAEIVWAKPAPMPESVADRPTRSHEMIYLFAKSGRYFYDAEAIREPSVSDHASGNKARRLADGSRGGRADHLGSGVPWTPEPAHFGRSDDLERYGRGLDNSPRIVPTGGRNARSVWTIGPEPFNGWGDTQHFATFPPALPERCIKAGSRDGDIILDPFVGSGTAVMVARRLGRRAIGIELNPEYAEMARMRISEDMPMFNRQSEARADREQQVLSLEVG